MSVEEEKTFVMKHVFTDIKNLEILKFHSGPQEHHFGVPWKLTFYRNAANFNVEIECLRTKINEEWSIKTTINTKILTKTSEKVVEKKRVFSNKDADLAQLLETGALDEYLVNDSLNILECHVTIHKMTGIKFPKKKRIFRSFDDELAKELSDIVLVVNDQKFYVNKMYLAVHSTYFKSLFLGSFQETKQSKVELKNIDSEDFQKFLEALYGEPVINDDNIEGILQLADMYDAKTVIRQCEHFYILNSQQDLKFKFNMATKYNMNQLLKKCMSEFKTVEDIKSVMPDDDSHLERDIYKQLLELATSLPKK